MVQLCGSRIRKAAEARSHRDGAERRHFRDARAVSRNAGRLGSDIPLESNAEVERSSHLGKGHDQADGSVGVP